MVKEGDVLQLPLLAHPTLGSPGTLKPQRVLLPGDLAAERSRTHSLAGAIHPSRLPAAPHLLPIANTDLLLQITVLAILPELPTASPRALEMASPRGEEGILGYSSRFPWLVSCR